MPKSEGAPSAWDRSILSEEEMIALIHNGIRPNYVLPTLVIQKNGQKSIEEQAGEIFGICTITVILALYAIIWDTSKHNRPA